MAPVMWIGGAPGAGKSTVGRALARRYGLRLYGTDTRTWEHRDRAIALRNPAAIAFETMTPRERWERPTGELVAMALHRDRGPMVLDDLRTLPPAPLIVAEGTTLPAYAADPARSVWLVPTPDFQRSQLTARGTPGPQARLYMALREVIAAEAATHRLPTVIVDGSMGPAETIRTVEAMLGSVLAQGPHAESKRDRQELLREQNRAAIDQVRGFFARPWATGNAGDATVRFVCECGDPTCRKEVEGKLRDYRSPCLAER
jgi:hypothetical protein